MWAFEKTELRWNGMVSGSKAGKIHASLHMGAGGNRQGMGQPGKVEHL